MSPFRPDLVDCWMFRIGRTARGVARPEILLLRRSAGRILPGLWQCVSGSLEPDERIAAGALRRRLVGPIWLRGALVTDVWIGVPMVTITGPVAPVPPVLPSMNGKLAVNMSPMCTMFAF